jgi:hypothetical protein
MNKPNMQVRGKKNRNQGPRPDEELQSLLQGSNAAVAERAGVSEAVAAEGREEGAGHTQEEIDQLFDAAIDHAADVLGVEPDQVVLTPIGVDMGKEGAEQSVDLNQQITFSASFGQESLAAASEATAKASVKDAAMSVEDALASPESAANFLGVNLSDVAFFMPASEVERMQKAHEAGVMVAMSWDELQKFRIEVANTQAFDVSPEAFAALGGYPIGGNNPGGLDLNTPEVDEYADKYLETNLKIVITRFPKGMPEAEQEEMRKLFTEDFQSVVGFRSGFELHAPASAPKNLIKLTLERPSSEPEFTWQERKKKAITRYFDAWGVRLGGQGVTDATSFDFWALEMDEGGTELVDAWKCTNMYPKRLGGIDSRAIADWLPSDRNTWFISATLSGEVSRSQSLSAGALEHIQAQAV